MKYLDGNRMTGVLEDAEPVTTPGSMDFAGETDRVSEYGYDCAGRLMRDESRGITLIEYDNLGHPVMIRYSGGRYTKHVYSAAGTRLKTMHSTGILSVASVDAESDTGFMADEEDAESGSADDAADGTADGVDDGMAEDGLLTEEADGDADAVTDPGLIGIETTEYQGIVVWRNGKVEMVLFAGGYATLANGSQSGPPTYHYYTTDYLGNVRAVTNGTTGATEQTVAYYPFGSVIVTLGTNRSLQPYKFGGKELLTGNGLNEYDFGARSYVPSVPAFTSVDPCSEKYYWLSPYLYCGNNPVNFIDPNGLDIWDFDINGNVINYEITTEYDMFRIVDENNDPIKDKSYKMTYGTVKALNPLNVKDSDGKQIMADVFQIIGDVDGTNAFEFLADNTNVEWQHAKTGMPGSGNARNYLTTTHKESEESGMYNLIEMKMSEGVNFREINHNHPNGTEYPSGFYGEPGDVSFASIVSGKQKIAPKFNIYISIKHKYIPYSKDSKYHEFNQTYPDLWN